MESLLCTAGITKDPKTGSFYYDGESRIDWDSQEPELDGDKRAMVLCTLGHTWESALRSDES